MIYLYADVLFRMGGIETYLHALATQLHHVGIPFRIAVSEQERSPILDDLIQKGIDVYRQRFVPGDRWHVRKRLLNKWLRSQLQPKDWVFCVRQPMAELYLGLVREVHAKGARIAASWIFAPEFVRPPDHLVSRFRQAILETDVVISVAHCTAQQFRDVYGYDGKVHVVNYHNLRYFAGPVAMPPHPPFRIGYMGRIDVYQKNLDTILYAFALVAEQRADVELHVHGGGPDEGKLRAMVQELGLEDKVFLFGPYDHRRDLHRIISEAHFFLYPSRFEGGPCFSLLEMLQAGRYVVASPVGGIPDLYADRPTFGAMVDPGDVKAVADGINLGIERVAFGRVDQAGMAAFYQARFSMGAAHRAWLSALELQDERPPEAALPPHAFDCRKSHSGYL